MEESLSEKDLLLLEIMTYSDDSLADAAADGISWGHPDWIRRPPKAVLMN